MFKHYISLGWYCGTAAALSKWGVRSFSSPFDWCFSDFRGVIHLLDANFEGFLSKDSITVWEDGKRFSNAKYGIHFMHDVKSSFEEEFVGIYEKYCKRIEKFQAACKEGVCFFRAVNDANELKFIKNEEKYINQVIKKYNVNNVIIYILPNFLTIPDIKESKFYALDIKGYFEEDRTILYELFDSNQELVNFCVDNFEENKRKDNLLFTLNKENKRLKRLEVNYKLMCKILKINFNYVDLPDKVAIYGVGDIGKLLYDKIKEKCTVTCFVDANPKQTSYQNIPIIKTQNYQAEEGSVVIVTPIHSFDEIVSSLESVCPSKIKIISIEELLR